MPVTAPRRGTDPAAPWNTSVRYSSLHSGTAARWGVVLTACVNMAFELFLLGWLLQSEHMPRHTGQWATDAAAVFVVASIGAMEALRLVNVVSLSVASVVARDPVPQPVPAGLRVALLTTIVPAKEPLETVRATLVAARQVRYEGGVDVWLLDEGDDDDVRTMCAELGIRHFSRRGVEAWNTDSGPFRAKRKHGNYNAWLDAHGDDYDVFLSVDPDHVPREDFAEHMLGYFTDPTVAYVVAPQSYANSPDSMVAAAAESQQFPFHTIIQRAANRYHCAMLVGTNNAVRISALRSIGGLRDSVTEDMATGLYLHSTRVPGSRRYWRSVYTPAVVAVGEGPSSFGDFYSQQDRWARGTFDVLMLDFWRRAWRLPPAQLLHYLLITSFYPSMALGWILGAVNAVLFAAVGAQGITVPLALWLLLYVDATAFQAILYIRNRRHNVSPFEAEGSYGLSGMAMSVLASPIFANALLKALLRAPASFVVTPKGGSATRDGLFTHRLHLGWGALFAASLLVPVWRGTFSAPQAAWPAVALLICLVPPVLSAVDRRRRRDVPVPEDAVAPHPGVGPTAFAAVPPPGWLTPAPVTTVPHTWSKDPS